MIPKNLTRNDDLLVVEKKDFEKITEENRELRLALKAIIAGENALKEGKTRPMKDFLKSVFPGYVLNN